MTTDQSRERAFLREALADPGWLLQQIDFHSDRTAFLRVPEATYRESPFLDQRLKAPRQRPVIARLDQLVETAGAVEQPCIHWIFHLGHVGSTYLSRLLGESEAVLPVREPVPLRTLAGLYRELDHPLAILSAENYGRWEHALFSLLGRTFQTGQRALVKATSDCCILLPRAMRAHPDSRAIWMHVDLETFLAGMLRNEVRRQETRGFAQTRLWDLHDLLGDQSLRLHELDIGEITAVSWLASQGHRLRALDAGFRERLLGVHFHDLLDRPGELLPTILEHLGTRPESAVVECMVGSRWHGTYAKDPSSRFDANERYRQLEVARREHAGTIEKALAFADGLVARYPVLSPLSAELRAPEDRVPGATA